MKLGFSLAQKALPGLLTPGSGWAGRVLAAGIGGMYQHMRNLGLEPGEELLAAMQARPTCRPLLACAAIYA